MTLLLTISAPDALVMAADSALTQRSDDGIIALAGFPKVVYLPDRHMGISFTGPAKVGGTYIQKWLQLFYAHVAESANPEAFSKELADALNSVNGARDNVLAFQIGTWITTGDPPHPLPILWEVSNSTNDVYAAKPLISQSTVDDFRRWQSDKSAYPIRIYTAGLPKSYITWIEEMLPKYSKLVDGQVPRPNGASLARLAEFLIRQVCELLVIAEKPAVVAPPIMTCVLLPTPTFMVTRFQ